MAGKKKIEGAADAASEAAAKGVDAAKGALGAVGNIIGKAKDKVEDVVDDIADDAKDAAKNAKRSIRKTKHAAEKAVSDAKENASEAAFKAEKAVKATTRKARDAVEDISDNVSHVASKGAAAAKDAIKDAKDALADAKDTLEDLGDKISDKIEDAIEDAKDGKNDLDDKVSQAGAVAVATGVAAVTALGATAAKGADAAKDAIDDVKTAIAEHNKPTEEDKSKAGAYALSSTVAVNAVSEKEGSLGGAIIPWLLIIGTGVLGWYGMTSQALKGVKGVTNPAITAPAATIPAWFDGFASDFKAKFPWLSLKFANNSIIASGEANDKNAKDAALAELALGLEATEGKGTLMIDDIMVKGSSEKPVGAALAGLGENPDVDTCGKAFVDTMAGRTINFATGAAGVNADSASLLDALTGIATACKAHKIEIAGHTDARGNAASNLKLSQERADAVKAYWVEKGVPVDGLTAKGYGATKPLDNAATTEAYAKNRRTEFTVSE